MTSEQTIVPSRRPDTARKRPMPGSAWAWLVAVLGVGAVAASRGTRAIIPMRGLVIRG